MRTCENCGMAIEKFSRSWVHSVDKNVVCNDLKGLAKPSNRQINARRYMTKMYKEEKEYQRIW